MDPKTRTLKIVKNLEFFTEFTQFCGKAHELYALGNLTISVVLDGNLAIV